MKIQNFVRDNAYYSALRDRDRPINAEDMDRQFAILQNFINSKIVPIIEGLNNNRLLGSTEPEDLECYLENIGDGNTKWSKIKFDRLVNNSLPWAKLIRAAEGSILSAGPDRSFGAIALAAANRLLTSNINNFPSWETIKNNHFVLRSISGPKVDYQTIGAEHFQPNIIGDDIDDSSITEIAIANGAVTGPKIADGAIDDSKIAPLLLQRRNNAAVWSNRSINANHLQNNSLDELNTIRLFFGNFVPSQSTLTISQTLLNKITQIIPDNGIELEASVKIYPQYHIANEAINLRHIKSASFSFANLHPLPTPEAINSSSLLNLQFLRTLHLSPRLKQAIGLN